DQSEDRGRGKQLGIRRRCEQLVLVQSDEGSPSLERNGINSPEAASRLGIIQDGLDFLSQLCRVRRSPVITCVSGNQQCEAERNCGEIASPEHRTTLEF